jgi:hypothetical protein
MNATSESKLQISNTRFYYYTSRNNQNKIETKEHMLLKCSLYIFNIY